MRVHGIRGQTFPIWLFGTLTVLCLLGFATNYGNMLYWQIRAQNAADAAAQGALSVQATHLNATIATLHAATVEEYRMRYILNDIYDVLGSTGLANQCTPSGSGLTSCTSMYNSLVANYIAATNRYTADVNLIENVDEPNLANDEAAINQAVSTFSTQCGTVNGGDCGFNYTVVNIQERNQAQMEDVYSDCCRAAVGGGTVIPSNLSPNLYPLEIEVVACAKVPPLFPAALNWIPGPKFTAVGRAAATTVMATQEFMEVGSVENPLTGQAFQPSEYPESPSNTPTQGDYDPLYRIDYGGNPSYAGTTGNQGNPAVANIGGLFHFTFQDPVLDVSAGWWTSVAEESYAGSIATPSNCAGS